MSSPQLRITLGGSERVVAAGTTAGEALGAALGQCRLGAASSPPGSTASCATWPSRWPTATWSSRSRSPVTTAAPSCATRPRTSWPRPCRSCSPRPSWASARRSRTASTTTSTCASPFTPDDLKRIEKRMREIVKQGQRFSRRVVTDDDARAELADEPYKLELIGLKGRPAAGPSERERRGRRRRADHLRQPRPRVRRAVLEGPVPRPAPADHPGDPGVQADAHRRRRTGGAARRTRSCSGSTAPRGSPATARTSTWTCLEEAEKRDHRKLGAELDLFSFPTGDRLRPGGLPPQGRHRPQGDGGLLAAAARGGGLRVRQHPAHHQGRPVRDLRPPGLVRRGHVPADASSTAPSTTSSR